MTNKKRIAVLGATGSIGKSSLDIIAGEKDSFEAVLLAARSSRQKLDEIKKQFPGALCVLTEEENGNQKLLSAIEDLKPDITINGIAGSAGLLPSVAAIKAGSHLALANKETIVMAGQYVMRLAREKKVNIIPVDSEHSAIFHLLRFFSGQEEDIKKTVREIILTASGGPFRKMSHEEMKKVTVHDALAHPTWNMGPKITIDSASMANKGLEVIEANAFFDMPPEKIRVVIHPQSIVHSMIQLCNGVVYCQLSKPDMRHPIHDALFWPITSPSSLEPVCFDNLTLDFSKPDFHKFPMLSIAFDAAKKGALYPCAYNAANEAAVDAFLKQKIKFTDIPSVTSHVMDSDWSKDYRDIQEVIDADSDARLSASLFIS
ncbi:MAG: 1-deoxy-D-xylulose-5-phosphate reductoisomerase [Treponema sp.]|nr:1-deoxy-D-xylulose-5-phosphate reductoisomerase [Treponema sp.]